MAGRKGYIYIYITSIHQCFLTIQLSISLSQLLPCLPCWKRRRNLATLTAEAFNRPRRRFFQPEDDPFDFPLGNKDPMYIHDHSCLLLSRRVFERFVGWAVVTEIPINKPIWDYCWVVKAAQLTGSTTDLFHFSPLFWKIQVWPKQDLDDGTLPMDDFDEDSAGSWDKGSFDVHQLNYLHCNKFIKIAFLDMWL